MTLCIKIQKHYKINNILFRDMNICGKTIMKISGMIYTKLRPVVASEKGENPMVLGGTQGT